jgi:hypothetical protein
LLDILKLWFNVFGAVFSTSEIHESLVGFFWAILFEKPARTMGTDQFQMDKGNWEVTYVSGTNGKPMQKNKAGMN